MPRPTLFDHPKFQRLVHMLEMPEPHVLGHLEFLWRVGYSSGNPVIGDAVDVEIAAKWTGERGRFCRALGDVKLIDELEDGKFQIHDLHENAPAYVKSRERMEKFRKKRQRVTGGGRKRNGSATVAQLKRTEALLGYASPAPAPAPAPSTLLEEPMRATPADVVAVWNETVTAPIPRCKLTTERSSKISARLKSYPEIDTWRKVIAWVNGQSWCRAPGTGKHPNWTADIDWLCKNDTAIQKALERMDASKQPVASGPVRDAAQERTQKLLNSVRRPS